MSCSKYLFCIRLLFILISSLFFTQCNNESTTVQQSLEEVILSDTSSFYYVDAKNYPAKNKNLPIGIFDSGTGGDTVKMSDLKILFEKMGFEDIEKFIASGNVVFEPKKTLIQSKRR